MKKIILLFSLLFFAFLGKAQTQHPDVEKNIAGIQIGIPGMDIYDEFRILDHTTINAAVNLYPVFFSGGFLNNHSGFYIYPAMTIQPKYYYNLDRRATKGRNTDNNSGNYLGLQFRYIPDWFVISNQKGLRETNKFLIIPTWGLRRSFSEHFNYDFRIGLGYGTTVGYEDNNSGAVFDISIKIGYDF